MDKSADHPADNPADQLTIRRLPADLSKELLRRTGGIWRELERPRLQLWGGNIIEFENSGVYVVKERIAGAGGFSEDEWFISRDHYTTAGLNAMFRVDTPDEIYHFALRHLGYNELRGRKDDNTEEIKELQHNTILERAMDEIDRLNAKVEELELRPPELGGTAFLAAKQHWEETTSGEGI